jgi:RNA polymerase sigma-70 factor (ECF subfamily)
MASFAPATELARPPSSSKEVAWNQILARILCREQQALAQLYDDSSRLVYSLVLRIVRDHAEAEEVTLDVYNYVWNHAVSYDSSRGSVTAWLMILARSRAIDRLRALGRRRAAQSVPVESLPELDSHDASPEQTSILRQQKERIRSALQVLPAEQRLVVERAYFGGLSQSELAEELGLPLGTVKTRARLGMMRLCELLSERAGSRRGEL